MKRFRSPLTTLLRLREQQQQRCELALAQHQQALSNGRASVVELHRRSDVETAATVRALQAGVPASCLLAMQSRRTQRESEIVEQTRQLEQLGQQVDVATGQLRTAISAATVVERLLSDRRREHRHEVQRQEQLTLDDQSLRRTITQFVAKGTEH